MVGSSGPAVSIQQLYLSYYRFAKPRIKILNGINLTVNKGSICTLIGPSGCGKTTLLRCVVGNLQTDQGIITVFGETPGFAKSNIPGSIVGYMPQELALDDNLTIMETLNLYGCFHHMKKDYLTTRINELLKFLNLQNETKVVNKLSGGEKRRVSFAIALLHKPKLLILDEPTVGVDPILKESIWQLLQDMCDEFSTTIIITTHHIEEAARADKIAFMRNGKILAQDSPTELARLLNTSTLDMAYVKLCREDNEKNEIPDTKSQNPLLIRLNMSANLEPECSVENIPKLNQKRTINDFFPPQSLRRIKALALKNFINMRRSTLLIIFLFLVPIIQVLSFGFFIGKEFHSVPVGVCNEDRSLGRKYLLQLSNVSIQQIHVESVDLALDLVVNGKAKAMIYIGSNFSNAIIKRFTAKGKLSSEYTEAGRIYVRYDNTNQPIVLFLQKTFAESASNFAKKYVGNLKNYPQLITNIFQVDKPIYGSEKASSQEFITSGVIVTVIFLLATGVTSLLFYIDKRDGVVHRHFVAGVTSFEILCGHFVTQFAVVGIQTAIVVALSIQIFQAHIINSSFLIIIISLIIGVSGMSFGFLISTLCTDVVSSIIVTIDVLFPLFNVSGTLWTLELSTGFIKTISPALPLTLSIESLRWIMHRSQDVLLTPVWKGFLCTTIWNLVFITLSMVVIRLTR